jgi:lipopolysaccharide export LptBFGC system permease protein LptF
LLCELLKEESDEGESGERWIECKTIQISHQQTNRFFIFNSSFGLHSKSNKKREMKRTQKTTENGDFEVADGDCRTSSTNKKTTFVVQDGLRRRRGEDDSVAQKKQTNQKSIFPRIDLFKSSKSPVSLEKRKPEV